ncbi:hypothetical protein EON79_14790 [bacterium]|nr:MAG: hypothetical protein EON79_14790 [bacterium]
MTATVTPRLAGVYTFGYDVTWADHGEDQPTLTLDPGIRRIVGEDGTFQARMTHVLERKIPLRLGRAGWNPLAHA